MIWIGYTTLYREGGARLERAARTMEAEKRARFPDQVVRCERVESKAAFLAAMERIAGEEDVITELHFVGHSGLYGIMFGTTDWPEQFSPHEWRAMSIPFAPDGEAYFHACRAGRWFAPFFARTFGVVAYGYHWYTTFSRRPDRFRWEARDRADRPLYVVSVRGRKSHGMLGSAMKYAGVAEVEPLKRFEPAEPEGDTTYDSVADLYDRAFDDITVRRTEWSWLLRHLPAKEKLRVLDIGCGNGSLLTSLGDRIAYAAGVDTSRRMIEIARRRAGDDERFLFHEIDGPALPFGDAAFDVVISFMSFRYLDWDPMMNEMRRVLAPGGKILIVDMAASPLRGRDLPRYAVAKAGDIVQGLRRPGFARDLGRLVTDPNWSTMLRYNPIRAEHEYRWYLASRFPGHHTEVLTVGMTHKLIAFDSGELQPGSVRPLSFP